jgi:DNA-binding NarL/FixJ family response regulator
MKPILQVDDDPNDVFLVQHAMRKMGVANPVQVVSDGQRAIDYLQGAGKFADRETFPYPCLVLMDLKLPYVMGLDVLRWIRAQPMTSLTVIILSASAEGSDISEAYRLGANAFLTKPSEASTLEDMVGAIKAFWLTHNTLPPEPFSEPLPLRMPGTPPATKSLFDADDPRERAGDGGNGNGPIVALHAESSSHQRLAQGSQAQSTTSEPLTRRQTEVVQLIAEGRSNRQIAHQLAVSLKTVEKHRQAVMDKLNIHEVATLTRYAISNGPGAMQVGSDRQIGGQGQAGGCRSRRLTSRPAPENHHEDPSC